MKPNSLSKAIIGSLLFSIGLGAGFFAQTLTDSAQRVEHKRSDLTAEAIVLNHEDQFSVDAVNAARKKLMDNNVNLGETAEA